MAQELGHQLSYALLFLFFFLLVSTEMLMVEGNLCERRSKTWTWFCGNSGHCNSQCRIWEGAQHGACHTQFPGFACFCYFTY
ncbi:defensin-like protein 19 [Quercus suber]|uniref:Defensin-like protein 19 n=1 Tax=Quercus suber TaxID=58331 RepID=A0AAW0J406_QUESU